MKEISKKLFIPFLFLFIIINFSAMVLRAQPFPVPAAGPTANDLVCDGCVDTSDIATDAVTGNEVLDNSLTSDDIAADTITGNEVLDNSLTFDDIFDGTGSGLDADMVDGMHAQELIIPQGGIIMWSGPIALIPLGWALCDGTNGTPDLTDRFILSVSANEDPGETGGAMNHSHSISGSGTDNHYHLTATGVASGHFVRSNPWGTEGVSSGAEIFIPFDGTYDNGGGSYQAYRTSTAKSSNDPTLTTETNQPPFFRLAFIMRLGG